MFRILHLSDIHIGKTYKESESIAYKIASDIDHNGLNDIKCIAVTGDIFDGQVKYTDSLINEAVNFFEILLEEINSSQEKNPISKEDVIFVPGNHDIIRVDDLGVRWSKYREFLLRFYGSIPKFYNEQNYSIFKEYKNDKIAFIGFNSCQIEKRNLFDENYISKFEKHIDNSKFEECGIDKSKIVELLKSEIACEYDDYGSISLSQIRPIERKIRRLDNYTIVALFHHHFYLFPEVAQQFGDSSLVRNYSEVIQHLRYMNVNIVLHGHKHFALERPFIMEDYYDSADNIIEVFAGGSVGTDRKDEHTFAVLDLYEKIDEIKFRHNKFIYHGENLEPIVIKQVPPQKSSGRVIKLLEILKILNPEKFNIYEETAEKAFKSYDYCNQIISWVSEAITGFDEVYKYLNQDNNNILFLLYAINFRTIYYMKIVGKEETYFNSISEIWFSFYALILEKTNFTISKDQYHDLLMNKELNNMTYYCDRLLNDCGDKKSQVYLAFTMVGVFFSDLYLILTRYADDFKGSIKYKVNIKIEENKFHENVPASRIVVWSDVDRRSIYIDLLCNEATAHKMAVLFIKEFDLLINKFEDYFKIIGLKLYYLLPRIDKGRMKNTIDNYNFEAYIPTLIPLLTGDNIYSSKEVFARELIQNSIDAISVREAKDERDFSKNILIEIKLDENGRRFFKITDRGTGMDRYKIERYFTSIGRSFYSGDEYEDLNLNYKPISNFGIGFLSSFMVCHEIDVETKYYINEAQGFKLHIPNYDGCFFIELENNIGIGTTIKLYLDSSVSNEDIVNYICEVMQDIKYDINIQYLCVEGVEKTVCIPAHSVRRKREFEELKFFVPFFEDGEIGDIDYCEEMLSDKYINKYGYGLFIGSDKSLQNSKNELILNSGIIVRHAELKRIFERNFRDNDYNFDLQEGNQGINLVLNFPANWLQLDVARESITGLIDVRRNKDSRCYFDVISSKIAQSLYNQFVQYIQYVEKRRTSIPAFYLQEVIEYAIRFCSKEDKELYDKLLKLKYILVIEFDVKGLCIKMDRNGKENEVFKILYTSEDAKNTRKIILGGRDYKQRRILEFILENRMGTLISHTMMQSKKNNYIYAKNAENVFQRFIGTGELINDYKKSVNDLNKFDYFGFFLLTLDDSEIISDIKKDHLLSSYSRELLGYFYVGDEQNQKVLISYDKLGKVDLKEYEKLHFMEFCD